MEKQKPRLNQIPVLHVKGTYSSVGFCIGRQFKNQMEDVMRNSVMFNDHVLPAYDTDSGRRIYETTLETCRKRFPNYVQELEGMADGAQIPFHKLFLLHLELTVSSSTEAKHGETGCSSILCNGKDIIMGHTEDASPELMNNVFIVSAEVLDEHGTKVEKFRTLTYAGCLPGYTMGFNEHGFIHTINTLYPLQTRPGKTPRSFLARALLGAKDLDQVTKILRNEGDGISDGFSVNAYFERNGKNPMMYNIEVCPSLDRDESIIDIIEVKPGDSYAHCNKFLRIEVAQLPKAKVSSTHRHEAIDRYGNTIDRLEVVEKVVSDRSDPDYPIFRFGEKAPDLTVTVACGIFDIPKRQWKLYIEQPAMASSPLAVIPLDF